MRDALQRSKDVSDFIQGGTPKDSKPAKPVSQLVKLSARIPKAIMNGLFSAQVDRKKRGLDNHKQQEVVAEILEKWLREHGYLED